MNPHMEEPLNMDYIFVKARQLGRSNLWASSSPLTTEQLLEAFEKITGYKYNVKKEEWPEGLI